MADVTVYFTPSCGDCRVAKGVFDQYQIGYEMIDIEDDIEAQRHVQDINGGFKSVPTIVLPSGAVMVEPNAPELVMALREEGLIPATA